MIFQKIFQGGLTHTQDVFHCCEGILSSLFIIFFHIITSIIINVSVISSVALNHHCYHYHYRDDHSEWYVYYYSCYCH